MGCQNSTTFENNNEPLKENTKITKVNTNKNNNNEHVNNEKDTYKEEDENILIGIYSGLLIRGLNFQNSLIKSQDELITNLRMFIPTKIQKKHKNQKITYGFNLDDKILTNSININFHKNYIIALTGFNNIENIKNSNGNYLIFHDGEINNEERYIAAVVKKIEGNPQILFSPQI